LRFVEARDQEAVKAEQKKKEAEEFEKTINDAAGVRKVLDLISASKKPVCFLLKSIG